MSTKDESSVTPNETVTSGVPEHGQQRSRFANLVDRKLGEFLMIRRLGSGGMADVYLAEQTTLKRHVAMKVLRDEYVSGETHLKRFEREATSAAGLNHPNIVQVYAIGEENGVHFIAQEYVKGLNLREFILRHGTPSASTAVHIMKQVAAALSAAAEAGIVHRDIKPENIMITQKGEVKVADFGLAQLTQSQEKLNLTKIGDTMGTPLYMSPEQVNGKQLDHRSDIYSFGVTCYHLLAGRPPFHGQTAISVAVKHLNDEPLPLSKRRPDLPPRLCDIVHRMMAKSVDQRFANAQEVLDDLKRFSKSLKHDPSAWGWKDFEADSASVSWLQRLSRHAVHPHAVRLIAACLAAVGISAGIGWLSRPGDPLQMEITGESRVPEFNTEREQYYYALSLKEEDKNKEEAWKAVIENFPAGRLETPRAREQLALLYLRSERCTDARVIFESFRTDEDPNLKATGLAGLAVLAGLQDQHGDVERFLAELNSYREKIGRKMAEQLLEYLIRQGDSLDDQSLRNEYTELLRGIVRPDFEETLD